MLQKHNAADRPTFLRSRLNLAATDRPLLRLPGRTLLAAFFFPAAPCVKTACGCLPQWAACSRPMLPTVATSHVPYPAGPPRHGKHLPGLLKLISDGRMLLATAARNGLAAARRAWGHTLQYPYTWTGRLQHAYLGVHDPHSQPLRLCSLEDQAGWGRHQAEGMCCRGSAPGLPVGKSPLRWVDPRESTQGPDPGLRWGAGCER